MFWNKSQIGLLLGSIYTWRQRRVRNNLRSLVYQLAIEFPHIVMERADGKVFFPCEEKVLFKHTAFKCLLDMQMKKNIDWEVGFMSTELMGEVRVGDLY